MMYQRQQQPLPQQQPTENRDSIARLVVTPPVQNAITEIADVQAEQALIGVVFALPQRFATLNESVQPGDFSILLHECIWKAFNKLTADGIDQSTVVSELRQYADDFADAKPDFDTWLNLQITKLAVSAPDPAHGERYAQAVTDTAHAIRLFKAAAEIAAAARNKKLTPDERESVSSRAVLIANGRANPQKAHISAAADEHYAKMEAAYNAPGHASPAISTGFQSMDDLFGGFYPGELIIGGGNDGMGKTSMLLSITRRAHKRGANIFHASGEVKRHEIISRFTTMETGIPSRALRDNNLSAEQWEQYKEANRRIKLWNYWFMDEYERFTVQQMRNKLYTIQQQGGQIDLIAADGIWLMDDPDPMLPRNRAVSNITAGLLGLAKDFNCPVVAMQQYNANPYTRKDKRPQRDDFAESAAVRRDAHLMLAMYRASYYDRNVIDENGTQVYVMKSRGEAGVLGSWVNLNYDMRRSMYMEFGEDEVEF